MKKTWIITIMAVVLLLSVCFVVHAADGESDITVNVSSAEAQPGETISLIYTLAGAPNVNTLGITLSYDKDVLELVDPKGEWLPEGAMLSNFDPVNEMAVLGYAASTDLNGDIFKVTFRVKEGVAAGTVATVGGTVIVKNNATTYENTLTPGTVTVKEPVHVHSYETVSETTKICSACGEINLTTAAGSFSGYLQKNDSANAVRILMVVSRDVIDDPDYSHFDMSITVNGTETKSLPDNYFTCYEKATAAGVSVTTDESCYLFGVIMNFKDLYATLETIEVSIVDREQGTTLFSGSADLT